MKLSIIQIKRQNKSIVIESNQKAWQKNRNTAMIQEEEKAAKSQG